MPDDNVVKMVNSLAADDNVAAQDTEAIKDAAGLDKVSGAVAPSVLATEPEKPEDETETTPEVEQPQDGSDEQPAV